VQNTSVHFVLFVVELEVVDAVAYVLNVHDVKLVGRHVTFENVNGFFKSVAYVEMCSVFVVRYTVSKHKIFSGN